MTWLEDWDEAGRRRQDRLAGRPVDRSPIGRGPVPPDDVHVWLEEWAPAPSDRPVNRSVHMPPAKTQQIRAAVEERADSAIARSVRWLLSRSGLGR